VLPSTAPDGIVRLFAARSTEAGREAGAVVDTYCASAFGGIAPAPGADRELRARLRRLRKIS
jgi:hypothetical protein